MSAEEISAIHSRLDKQDDMLRSIHGALVGNEGLGHRGIVSRIDALEKSDAEHTTKLVRWGGIVAGASLALQLAKEKLIGGN